MAVRVVAAAAAQPEKPFKPLPVDREPLRPQELPADLLGDAPRIVRRALHGGEHLGQPVAACAPLADQTAAQVENLEADVLDADGTRHFAGAAREALEQLPLVDPCLAAGDAGLVADDGVAARKKPLLHLQHDPLGIERAADQVRRAVVGAAAALDAGVDVQNVLLGKIGERDHAEVVVVLLAQRAHGAGDAPAEEDRERSQDEVQVLGVRNQPEHAEQRPRMHPPVHPPGLRRRVEDQPVGEIGCHQGDDEERHQGGCPGHVVSEGLGTDHEPPVAQAQDPRQHCNRPDAGEVRIPRMTGLGGVEAEEPGGEMLQAHPREREEAPHDQGMQHTRNGPLADHPRLQDHFREHRPEPAGNSAAFEIALPGFPHGQEPNQDGPDEVGGARQNGENQQDPFKHSIGSYRGASRDPPDRGLDSGTPFTGESGHSAAGPNEVRGASCLECGGRQAKGADFMARNRQPADHRETTRTRREHCRSPSAG